MSFGLSRSLHNLFLFKREQSYLAPMRIRQRKGRFPISFLSPIPLSDSHLSRSPVVQLEQHSNPHGNLSQEAPHTAAAFDPQPSDQPNQPIGGQSKGQDSSDASGVREEKKVSSEYWLVGEKITATLLLFVVF